jgi:shikimate dehydrogenase
MRYGLIGEHLGHSFSKEIHESISDYEYEICEIEPQNLGTFLSQADFCGINITIPYKEKSIPYLHFVSDKAQKIGAVNTVKNENGTLYGYNTDFDGLSALISRIGVPLTGKRVFVLGTGGTSRTACAVARALGAASVLTVGRIPSMRNRDGFSYLCGVDLGYSFEKLPIIVKFQYLSHNVFSL